MGSTLPVAAVLRNCITAGDPLLLSLGERHLWTLGGMDFLLPAGALVTASASQALAVRSSRLHV
jgi:hypothetical protein